jgi:hypothetical protein
LSSADEDYWNKDRWTDEEEEEEVMNGNSTEDTKGHYTHHIP